MVGINLINKIQLVCKVLTFSNLRIRLFYVNLLYSTQGVNKFDKGASIECCVGSGIWAHGGRIAG